MRSGFRPRDRDRMVESMEGSLLGFGPLWKGCWAAKREGLRATRLTVGVPNDLQKARNLSGGLPVIYQDRSSTLGPFRERFSPAHKTRTGRGDGCMRVCLCSERTTERTGGTRTHASLEKYANEMPMMTWKSATRKQMTWE